MAVPPLFLLTAGDAAGSEELGSGAAGTAPPPEPSLPPETVVPG
jgi:hypothetical protein